MPRDSRLKIEAIGWLARTQAKVVFKDGYVQMIGCQVDPTEGPIRKLIEEQAVTYRTTSIILGEYGDLDLSNPAQSKMYFDRWDELQGEPNV